MRDWHIRLKGFIALYPDRQNNTSFCSGWSFGFPSTVDDDAESLAMELFIRRRWAAWSAQQSNNNGILLCMCYIIFLAEHKHNSFLLGPIQPSSPTAKELHGLTLEKRWNFFSREHTCDRRKPRLSFVRRFEEWNFRTKKLFSFFRPTRSKVTQISASRNALIEAHFIKIESEQKSQKEIFVLFVRLRNPSMMETTVGRPKLCPPS